MSSFSELTSKNAYESRVYYDTLHSYNNIYPSTASRITHDAQRCFPAFAENSSKYLECKWEIFNADTSERMCCITFSSVQAIADWKNANVASAGGVFTENVAMRPYDIIDSKMPTIDRIYGQNALYGAFKGRKNYSSGLPHAGGMHQDFPAGGEVMYAMWAEQYP
ncbi:MAG: hypothetical protein DRQ47_08250, partial [Gammaproteobacteria bacterium]